MTFYESIIANRDTEGSESKKGKITKNIQGVPELVSIRKFEFPDGHTRISGRSTVQLPKGSFFVSSAKPSGSTVRQGPHPGTALSTRQKPFFKEFLAIDEMRQLVVLIRDGRFRMRTIWPS